MPDNKKLYKLLGTNGKTYLSEDKGTLGGTRTGKLYGRLDCPSALRALSKPTRTHYIKHRVFFKDEETALAAGYRPCCVCMREHYNLWKAGKRWF